MNAFSNRSTTPLGFRIIVWTIATIFLAPVAAAIWPVVVDPVVYILRYSLDQILGLEFYWRRLQPMTRGFITLAFLFLLFVSVLASAPRKPKDGDGSEEYF